MRRPDLAGSQPQPSPHSFTILVISPSAKEDKFVADWAAVCAGVMVRRCPICEHDSIEGHGWRRKQAHDEQHDWIRIHRGVCQDCGKTFTLLPCFSLPYTHYSLLARGQALHQRFVEGRGWDSVALTLKDSQRVADPATLRRWFGRLQGSAPPLSKLRSVLAAVSQRLSRRVMAASCAWQSSWLALVLFLPLPWPWPLRL